MKKIKIIRGKGNKIRKNLVIEYEKLGWTSCRNEIPKKLIVDFNNLLNKLSINKGYKDIDDLTISLNKENKLELKKFFDSLPKKKEFKLISTHLKKKIKTFEQNTKLKMIASYLNPAMPNDTRLTYDFHQESNYLNKKYKKNKIDILTAHFPLVRGVDKKNGSMSALSESHLEGNYSSIIIKGKKNGFKSYTPTNINMIKKKHEEVLFKLETSDVLYFTKNLIHKSNINNSKKCRFIGIIRFTR